MPAMLIGTQSSLVISEAMLQVPVVEMAPAGLEYFTQVFFVAAANARRATKRIAVLMYMSFVCVLCFVQELVVHLVFIPAPAGVHVKTLSAKCQIDKEG
jgi:hypothetical protein